MSYAYHRHRRQAIHKQTRWDNLPTNACSIFRELTWIQNCILIHINSVVYQVDCPEKSCQVMYIGEIACRLQERVKNHSGRDTKSNVFNHTVECNHPPVSTDDFVILAKSKRMTNFFIRKTIEAIYIKNKRPTLNAKEKSLETIQFIRL